MTYRPPATSGSTPASPATTLAQRLRQWSVAERAALAGRWGLAAAEAASAEQLAQLLLQPALVEHALAGLSAAARLALLRLQELGGSANTARLTAEFGQLRFNFGYPNPRASHLQLYPYHTALEELVLLGLVDGDQAKLAIPPDLLAYLPPPPGSAPLPLALAGTPPGQAQPYGAETERSLLLLFNLAYDGQLEITSNGGLTKASMLRVAKAWEAGDLKGVSREDQWPFLRFLRSVAQAAGLLRAGADAKLRATRQAIEWLNLPAAERSRALLDAWVASEWDELVTLVGLKFLHAQGRDLPAAKRAVLRLLRHTPTNGWVTLSDWVAAVKTAAPHYARPDGRYDRWGIVDWYRNPADGFEHWDAVEGRQLRAIVDHTCYWLGLVELGLDAKHYPLSFRLTPLGAALLAGTAPPAAAPAEPLVVQPNFEVLVPPGASLASRFQIARLAELVSDQATTIYRLTRRSMQAALERGATLDELLGFLAEASGRAVAQNVAATIREWAGQVGRLTLTAGVLLNADDPLLLEKVRHDKRLRLPMIEQLSPTQWLLQPGDAAALAERLRKAGYSLVGDTAAPTQLRENDLTVLYAALDFYARASHLLEVEDEASGALFQRLSKLLSETQRERAARASHMALTTLRKRLHE